MLTQVDYRYNPPRESLIDYALLPVHLYSACTSVLNNFHHNDYGDANSTGVVKTGHAMTCVTFNDDLVLAHEEEHQKATISKVKERVSSWVSANTTRQSPPHPRVPCSVRSDSSQHMFCT